MSIERACRNCEYFDGGGLNADNQPKNYHGDCLNHRSPRFETNADNSCHAFYPDTGRYPAITEGQ